MQSKREVEKSEILLDTRMIVGVDNADGLPRALILNLIETISAPNLRRDYADHPAGFGFAPHSQRWTDSGTHAALLGMSGPGTPNREKE